MAALNPMRLLIAEDHSTLRDAFNIFFGGQDDIEVVGQAADTRQALSLTEALQPDVILIDSKLSPTNAPVFIGRLCDASPDTRIVVFASTYDETPAEKYLEAGAATTVAEGIFASDLLTVIQQVYYQG